MRLVAPTTKGTREKPGKPGFLISKERVDNMDDRQGKMIAEGMKHVGKMSEIANQVNSYHYASGYVIGGNYEKLGEAMAALLLETGVDEFEDRAHALIAEMTAYLDHKNK